MKRLILYNGDIYYPDMGVRYKSYGVALIPIGLSMNPPEGINIFTEEELRFPTYTSWQVIREFKEEDYSRYKPETCRNGGDYGYTYLTRYFARIFENRLQVRSLVWCSTTADFSYSDSGIFTNDISYLTIVDAENLSYSTQKTEEMSDCFLEDIWESVSVDHKDLCMTPVQLYAACKKAGLCITSKMIRRYFRKR